MTCKRILPVAALWALSVTLIAGAGSQNVQRDADRGVQPPAVTDDAALVKQYCLGCHNERAKQGGLVLDVDVANVAGDRERWEKVVRKVRTGMMPPSGAPRPARERLDAFAASMAARLDAASDLKAMLDTPALHRLNRTEYAKAIRDLLDLLPQQAVVRRGGGTQAIGVAEIQIGDLVLVKPGSRIPVDGSVIAGHSFVDQSAITGESLPVEKIPGRVVYAGTINQAGALEVRTGAIGPDTAFGKDGVLLHGGASGRDATDGATAIAIDAAGRIVVAGTSGIEITIWRINP